MEGRSANNVGGMAITPEELVWIKRRIELAKLISISQHQQQRHPPTQHDAGVLYSAIGSPPIAGISVPPVTIHKNSSPMLPLVVSAAPTLMVHNHHLYQPHLNNAQPHQHIYPQTSAFMMPNGTFAIPNTSLSPPSGLFTYRRTSGGGYDVLLAPTSATAPAHSQPHVPGRSYSPEDDLTRKITHRIQAKLKRLNPNGSSKEQQLPLSFLREHIFQLETNNAEGVGFAAGSDHSVAENGAATNATTQFKMTTADFEKKSEFAVRLIRKRVEEIVARGRAKLPARSTDISVSSAGLPEPSDISLDTIPTTLSNLDTTRRIKLDTKPRAKRKRHNQPNIEKISEELNNVLEKCLDDENIRCALNEDKVNLQGKRDERKELYKKCIKDVESRLEMYTKLEHLSENIAVSRMARGKKRNSSNLDWQIEGDCDTIFLHLNNYRMLEDEMDRILGISEEE